MFCLWFLEMVGYVMVSSTVLTEKCLDIQTLEVSSLNYPTCKIPLKKNSWYNFWMNFFLNGRLQELVSIDIEQ